MAIEELMDGLIKDHNVDAVFIEDIQFRTNINTLKKLAHLQGVLINIETGNDNLADAICIGWYVVKAVEIDPSKGIVKKKAI